MVLCLPGYRRVGIKEWIKRLKNPTIRKKVLAEMRSTTDKWENLMLNAGPDGVLLLGFTNDLLKRFVGKTIGEVAVKFHGKSPEETAMDLVITDSTRVEAAYF